MRHEQIVAAEGTSSLNVERRTRGRAVLKPRPREPTALASDFNAVSGAHLEPPAANVSLGHCSRSLFTVACFLRCTATASPPTTLPHSPQPLRHLHNPQVRVRIPSLFLRSLFISHSVPFSPFLHFCQLFSFAGTFYSLSCFCSGSGSVLLFRRFSRPSPRFHQRSKLALGFGGVCCLQVPCNVLSLWSSFFVCEDGNLFVATVGALLCRNFNSRSATGRSELRS